jgi:hypothetical protein
MTMPSTTEVRDRNENGGLAVTMAELLTLLSTHMGPVDWHILHLNGECAAWGDIDMNALLARIQGSPAGTKADAEELFQLAGELERVTDALLCVPAEGATPQRPVSDAFYRDCRVALQCIAGDRWSITTEDADLHQLLRETFKEVTAPS